MTPTLPLTDLLRMYLFNRCEGGMRLAQQTCDFADINVSGKAEASGMLVIHRTAYMTGARLRARDKIWKP